MEVLTIKRENRNKNQNPAFLVGIFIIWPFLGLLLAIKNFQFKINRNIILFFFIIYGLLFYVNPLTDSQRRADALKFTYSQPFEKFYETINSLYEETLDFTEPFLMYIVSRVTDFYGILFALYAFIFGSFMLYYFKVLHKHYTHFKNKNAFIFLLLLVFVNPINNINGFRMWTAAWIFAVGVLNYLHTPKWKHLLLICSAVFVHFSFIPLIIIVFIYKFAGNRTLLYGILAIITFFIAELDVAQVRESAAILGNATETKIDAYTNEDHVENVLLNKDQAAWYIKLNDKGMLYFSAALLLLIYLKTKGFFKTKITNNFYAFSLMLLSFANISSLLPSGSRFYRVFYIFAFSTFLLYYVYEEKKVKIQSINLLGLPLVILFIFLNFRFFTDSASAYLLGPSFMMPVAFFENTPLKSLLF
jgi:hypothetical protein